MPSWNDLLLQIKQSPNSLDAIRRGQLRKFQEYRGRNLICYYSGWLDKPNIPVSFFSINDSDVHSFMCVLKGMDKTKGLDLFLHTPGGSLATTKKIVDYLRSLFGPNIEVFVPHLAMSGGTMIACASKLIHMGKHSSLGPTDPQVFGTSAYSVQKVFRKVEEVIKEKNIAQAQIWMSLIQKYHPSFVVECSRAIEFSKRTMKKWIMEGEMFSENEKEQKAQDIVKNFNDEKIYENIPHDVQIGPNECIEKGLKINELENPGNKKLQEYALSIHHAYMITLSSSPVYKIVENHEGVAKCNVLSSG